MPHIHNHCIVEQVAAKTIDAAIVFENEQLIAFLDHRPLFLGHTLLAPKQHVKTLMELPENLILPLFSFAKTLAKAVQAAVQSDGIFVAMNNEVSQSIPHVHIIPRNKGDGLKGFFWPRMQYQNDAHRQDIQLKIKAELNP